MHEYIKRFLSDDRTYFGTLIILVALGSFGLGRQSLLVQPNSPSTVVTETQTAAVATPISAPASSLTPSNPVEVSASAALDTSALTLVASKNGTKYHRLDCPGAKQIADKNKITFASIAEARAAGYMPAANCQGLE